ncbi:hypothetical protein CPAR01_09082 [Colletotrichum paranaense]|uniref:Uncharacterized protein n=1 Tax=Colletotrichum paranaense TaxID=1914294 RepID=A0ABQ9SFR2_9PEZI|nr:uncharacterized protein CPAR01_09082 [Colletotrichum paranaense]KAK1535540.1 hypothetical protein CPAR01_09082 [Colletotrichum paranaense]
MDGRGWLNLVQNDQNPHFFASASFDIILVPSLSPSWRPRHGGICRMGPSNAKDTSCLEQGRRGGGGSTA